MKMIDNDMHLSKMFASSSTAKSNKLVQNLRDDILSDLLQLVEIALIEQQDDKANINPEVMKKRLSEISMP